MTDTALLIIGIALLAVVVISGAAVAFAVKTRRSTFAGPARDAWELTRHDLSRGDQWRVQWAAARRRPVTRSTLALPQLVYSRFVQFQSERSPLHRRSFRIGFTLLYVVLAAQDFVNGVRDSHSGVFDFVLGAMFAFCAVMWGLVLPQTLNQGPLRMKRLRQQIRERHPAW
jgi:hypothetical protein